MGCQIFIIFIREVESGPSLTNFKLAWKMATLLAFVTAKPCSGLALLCIDNQHLFLQYHAAILVLASGDNMD